MRGGGSSSSSGSGSGAGEGGVGGRVRVRGRASTKKLIRPLQQGRSLLRKLSWFASETFTVCFGHFHASETFMFRLNFHGLLRKLSRYL